MNDIVSLPPAKPAPLAAAGALCGISVGFIVWATTIPPMSRALAPESAFAVQGVPPTGAWIALAVAAVALGALGYVAARARGLRSAQNLPALACGIGAIVALACGGWAISKARAWQSAYMPIAGIRERLASIPAPSADAAPEVQHGFELHRQFIENAAKDAQGQGEVLGDNASPEEVAIAMRERFDAIAAAPEMSGHDVGALRRRLHEHEGALATIAGEPQPPPIESAVPPPPGDGAGNPGGGGGGGGRPPQQLSAFEKAAAAGACLYVGLPPPLCETLIALFNEIFDLSGGDIERVIAVAAGAIGSDGSVDGFDPNRLFEDFREAGFEDPEQARRALEGFVQEARRNGSLTGDIGPITDALNRLNLGGIRECIQGARDSIVAQAQTDLALVLPGGQRQFLMDRLGEYVQSLPRVCDEAVRSPVLGAGPPLGHKACVVNTILFHARPPLAPEPVGCSLILRLDNVAP